MWAKFWKASLISLAAYAAVILLAVWLGLWIALFVPALQLVWASVCIVRVIQLRRSGIHRADALIIDREDYEFYVGSLTSSSVLLGLLVVWSQLLTAEHH